MMTGDYAFASTGGGSLCDGAGVLVTHQECTGLQNATFYEGWVCYKSNIANTAGEIIPRTALLDALVGSLRAQSHV